MRQLGNAAPMELAGVARGVREKLRATGATDATRS